VASAFKSARARQRRPRERAAIERSLGGTPHGSGGPSRLDISRKSLLMCSHLSSKAAEAVR
jgi:hypothetical protein